MGEEKKSKSKKWWIIGLIFVLVFILGGCLFVSLFFLALSGTKIPIGDCIALIHIQGIIADTGSESSIFTTVAATPERIIKQLKAAEEDGKVKVILLRINSPGGTAAASQEIYKEVARINNIKPVVVSIGDMGASGAYWISCGARKIMASPASSVGSIGVIMEIPNYEELYNKLGVKFIIISKGKYKDIGSPARPMTEEEKNILQGQVNQVYEQFIETVAQGRKIPKDKVEEYASGLVFTGTDAKGKKLIDELGNFQDAINLSAKLGQIKGKPTIIRYDKITFSDILFGSLDESVKTIFGSLIGNLQPQWQPGQGQITK